MNQENHKTTDLAEARETLPSVAAHQAAAEAEVFATASRAASTWRAYESDWRIFCHLVPNHGFGGAAGGAGNGGDVAA